MQRLAESIDSVDGVANAVIFEAAKRLDELQKALQGATSSLILARNERDECHAEIDAIRKTISDAGFSEVVEPLERVKRLIQERDEAICKMERLKKPKHDRIQIAATILAGSHSNCSDYNDLAKIGLKQADALIAAAKEGQ